MAVGSFVPPVLLQLVCESASWDADMPSGVRVIHRGEIVPQVFVEARGDRIDVLASLPGVLRVDPTEQQPASYAIGLDRVLSCAAAAGYGTDGWNDRPTQPPLAGWYGPAVTELIADANAAAKRHDSDRLPSARWRLACTVLSKSPTAVHADDTATADPVGVATLAAYLAGAPTFLAAGNDRTLTPWALDPRTITVAATVDAAGTAVHPKSGRATTEGPAPSVAAWAASELDESVIGTSFAAPRAAREHSVLSSLGDAVVAAASRVGGRPRLVPVAVVGIVDAGPWSEPPPLAWLHNLPSAGPSSTAVEAVLARLDRLGVRVGLEPPPVQLALVARSWLLRSARAVPNAGREEVGAGFVCSDTTIAWCARMTGADIAPLFAIDFDWDSPYSSVPEDPELAGTLVTAGADVGALRWLYAAALGVCYADHDAGTVEVR
jgi:hypothetical protein